MRVLFHPEFPADVRRHSDAYAEISVGLGARFRTEVDEAIAAIKTAPTAAGHFLNLGSAVVPDIRRRNLHAFPFFVLYGFTSDGRLIFGAVIASRSDPLTWLARFRGQ